MPRGMLPRMKESSAERPPPGRPDPSWLAGAAIGLAILGMASGAVALGAGWALTGAATKLR